MDVSSAVVDVSSAVVGVSSAVVDVSSAVVDVSSAVVGVSSAVAGVSSAVVDVTSAVVDVSSTVVGVSSAVVDVTSAVVDVSSAVVGVSSPVAGVSRAASGEQGALHRHVKRRSRVSGAAHMRECLLLALNAVAHARQKDLRGPKGNRLGRLGRPSELTPAAPRERFGFERRSRGALTGPIGRETLALAVEGTNAQPPATLDDVLASLEAIVDEAIQTRSPIGYFGALYERVTLAIKRAIVARSFEDNDRMGLLDRAFAGRFLDAWDRHKRGAAPTASWAVAFDALSDRGTLIIQHLLLGINAHINLDLGIAAATIAPGAAIGSLKDDFDKINAILARLVGAVQLALDEVSPRFKTIEAVAWVEDKIFDFALDAARDGAWAFAVKLAALSSDRWGDEIAARDVAVVGVARAILNPGALEVPVLKWILDAESSDISLNIQIVGG